MIRKLLLFCSFVGLVLILTACGGNLSEKIKGKGFYVSSIGDKLEDGGVTVYKVTKNDCVFELYESDDRDYLKNLYEELKQNDSPRDLLPKNGSSSVKMDDNKDYNLYIKMNNGNVSYEVIDFFILRDNQLLLGLVQHAFDNTVELDYSMERKNVVSNESEFHNLVKEMSGF